MKTALELGPNTNEQQSGQNEYATVERPGRGHINIARTAKDADGQPSSKIIKGAKISRSSKNRQRTIGQSAFPNEGREMDNYVVSSLDGSAAQAIADAPSRRYGHLQYLAAQNEGRFGVLLTT